MEQNGFGPFRRTLEQMISECIRGAGGTLLITGSTGSGKTHALRLVQKLRVASKARYLGLTGRPAEKNVEFRLLQRLFDDPVFQGDELPLSRFVRDTPRSSRALLGHLARTRLLAAAEAGPLVIGLDDLQHADPTSVHCLRQLCGQLHSTRILVIATHQQLDTERNPLFDGDFWRLPRCHRMRLPTLSDQEVRELLADEIDGTTAQELNDAVVAAAGGNPSLANALARDVQSESVAAPGEEFRAAVLACLHGNDLATQRIAHALAVLGDEPPELVAPLLRVDPHLVTRALRTLDREGITQSGRFRHPATRDAVLADLAPAERRDLHREAAMQMHEHTRDVHALGTHLLAGEPVRRPWAVAVLFELAERAMADEPELAGRYLDAAGACVAGEVDRSELLAKRAALEWSADPATVAVHLPELADAATSGLLSRRWIATTAEYAVWHGRPDEARRLFQLAEGSATKHAKTSDELKPHSSWLAHPTKPLPEPRLAAVSTTNGPVDHAQDKLEQSPRQAEVVLHNTRSHRTELPSVEAALLTLIQADQNARAAGWCEHFLREEEVLRWPAWQARFTALSAEIALKQGDPAKAEVLAGNALRRMPHRGWGIAIGRPLATGALAALALGRTTTAERLLATPVPDAMTTSSVGLLHRRARGRHLLAAGWADAALAEFLGCGRNAKSWGLDFPTVLPWRTDAAEAHLTLGDPASALELAEKQLAMTPSEHARTRGITCRVLAAASDQRARLEFLRQATHELRQAGDEFELARAEAELDKYNDTPGRMQRSDDRTGTKNSGPLLSPAEAKVTDLVLSGHTNRAIAAKLFITISTVEQHLTRVYRKLGVSRRADLLTVLDPACC